MGNEKYLMGVAAVADYLQVHYNTAHKLITNGTIPATKVGAQWRVKVEDIDAYIHSSMSESNERVDLPEIIAIVNQKGGVGKSTLSINLSEALGKLGKKVLLMDLDPQSNSSTGVGINAEAMAIATITEVLIDSFPIHEAIVDSKFGFDIIPTTIALSEAEMELIMRMSRESVLFNALFRLEKQWTDLSPAERKEKRHLKSKPILEAFSAWLSLNMVLTRDKWERMQV